MEPGKNALPDASALLRSLTTYLPVNGQQQRQYQHPSQQGLYQPPGGHWSQQGPSQGPWTTNQPHGPYGRQYYAHHQTGSHAQGFPQSQTPQPASSRPQQESRASTPSAKPIADPRTIITWPSALRYVSHRAATDDDFLPRIRGMIKNQHDHERQWRDGREALVRQQGARAGGKKELDDVLTMIGVSASDAGGVEDEKAELALYDGKVHKAQMQMVKHMTQELRELGVPFFCTRERFIAEGEEHVDGKLAGKELQDFQKQVLGFLEEMCKE